MRVPKYWIVLFSCQPTSLQVNYVVPLQVYFDRLSGLGPRLTSILLLNHDGSGRLAAPARPRREHCFWIVDV